MFNSFDSDIMLDVKNKTIMPTKRKKMPFLRELRVKMDFKNKC